MIPAPNICINPYGPIRFAQAKWFGQKIIDTHSVTVHYLRRPLSFAFPSGEGGTLAVPDEGR